MPQVLINNNHCTVQTEGIRTIGELIPKVKDDFLKQGEFLFEILLDGKSITPGQDQSLLKLQLEEYQQIDFRINSKASVAQSTIDYLPEFLESLINDVRFCLDRDEIVNTDLYKIIEKIDIYIQLMTQIHKVLTVNIDQRLDIGMTIKDLEVHLLFIVKAINSSYRKKDYVILEDLLEHELIDNLTQWKIQALPKIKRLNSL